jgi:NADPH:quinone reductase-like Zn-dependent oxidoreductase
LELIGAPNLPGDLDALAVGGRVVVIGLGGGAHAQVNLGALMARRGRVMGSTLRVRPLEAKAVATRAVEAHVLPLFESGRLVVPVAATFALDDAVAAYERFAAGAKFGKIVLTMA